MQPVLFYCLKVSVSLSIVYLFYRGVLQKLTFYTWNRWYLLVYSLLSFFIPFVDISPLLERHAWEGSQLISWVPVMPETGETFSPVQTAAQSWDPSSVCLLLILAGMLFMLGRLVIQFLSFRRMLKKADLLSGDQLKLYQVNEPIMPFSFGNAVFISRQQHSEEELQEIIRHEMVHIRQRHSMDMLWGELLCLLNWFNPFAWLLKRSIRQNLEFIADDQVLQHGISKKDYQYLLLKVTGNHRYSIATPFSFSSLKKRIAMMNKSRSAKLHLFRFFFLLPLLVVALLAFRKQYSAGSREEGLNAFFQSQLIGSGSMHHPEPAGEVFSKKDTIPAAESPNQKGYRVSITDAKGNCMVEIRDKNGSLVKKIPLTDWNRNAARYEGLYGTIPPPPAPPVPAAITVEGMPAAPAAPGQLSLTPVPPPPPPAPRLPAHVSSISIQNQKATVKLKNGQMEEYDLSVPAQKKEFNRQYGQEPPTPEPPVQVNGYRITEPAGSHTTPRETGQTMVQSVPDDLLYLVDGKKVTATEVNNLAPSVIQTIHVLKGKDAENKYGEDGKKGVIEITTRPAAIKEVVVTGYPVKKTR